MPRTSKFDSQRPRLKGKLNRPIRIPAPPDPPSTAAKILLPESEREYEKERQEWQKNISPTLLLAKMERMSALLEHYKSKGINTVEWAVVAFQIADDYVPAFEVKYVEKKKDHLKSWETLDLFTSVNCILEDQKVQHPHNKPNVSKACKELQREKKWKHVTANTLENRYLKAKAAPIVKLFEKMLPILPNKSWKGLRSLLDDIKNRS